jgi:AIPR protein
MPANPSHIAQIQEVFKQRYFPIIPPLAQNWTPEQHEKNRFSRSLAAFAIEKSADVSHAQAVNSIMDGGNDNGIDAVHFDRLHNRLWLVQAKAGGAPDSGDNKKFCDGIRAIAAGDFTNFNASFARLQSDVEDALETSELVIVGCHAYMGDQLGQHAITDLNNLATELNQFVHRFEWQDLNCEKVHNWLTSEHVVAPVSVTLTLENWYGVTHPRLAFYGLVGADQLAALYAQHGKTLFEKNIRHYLGAQPVNQAIAETVRVRPAELFYLNNGLTAVCSKITPPPGQTHNQATFTLEGFSVVNGAQTVGSIFTAQTAAPISADAKILITLIQVGVAPGTLGIDITRARNTQNAVRGLHFAALDSNQERLRRELKISGIEYHYRPSEEAVQGGENSINFQEAALALACFSGDTRIVVAAKKEISQIHDRNGVFYPLLFTNGLTGIKLCRYVRVFKYLNGILGSAELAERRNYWRRMFFRHGRFFILHIFARRHKPLLEKPEIEISQQDKTELSRLLLDLAELIYTAAHEFFKETKGYLAIFRNNTDAQPLAQDVTRRLVQLDAQRAAPPAAVAAQAPPPTPAAAPAPATPASPAVPPPAIT